MAKVHEYLLILPNGTVEVTKSNGPICSQQSRQEVGGHFESFDPQLGAGFYCSNKRGRQPVGLGPKRRFQRRRRQCPHRPGTWFRNVGPDTRAPAGPPGETQAKCPLINSRHARLPRIPFVCTRRFHPASTESRIPASGSTSETPTIFKARYWPTWLTCKRRS